MDDKADRAFVITGASSGIGRACALRLDALGYRVIGTYLEEGEDVALLAEASDRLTMVRMDVTDESTVRSAVEYVEAQTGERGLSGLVNNAGIDTPGPLEFLPLDTFRHQVEVNVIGLLGVTQAFLPLIRKAQGRIVNMGSIDGKAVTPFQGAYGASKHAVEALTDGLRMELRPWNIHVAVVEPGDIRTPIWSKSLAMADTTRAKLPVPAEALYGPLMTAARATAEKMAQRASDPAIVVKAVVHALTARKPRTRYLVGNDAKIRLGMEWLPTRWVDKIIMDFIAGGAK